MAGPTLDDVLEAVMADENTGWCLACGAQRDGIEPDAHHYECWECGELQVFAAEELLVSGMIV